MPGVVAAGWTSGSVEMDRTIRFAAAEWRDGDKVNKDKIAAAMSRRAERGRFRPKPAGAAWNANTGKLKLTFKRPSQIYPRARPHREHRDHRAGVVRTNRALRTG